MAFYGYIVERSIAASDIDKLNLDVVAASGTNVDGGNLVVLGAYAQGVYTVTLATAASTAGGLAMAYNPEEHLTAVNGQYFAGLSKDPRNYTNIGGRNFTAFIPTANDIIGFTTANINGTAPTAGQYLIPAANGQVSASSSAPSTGTYFVLLDIENQPFPQAGIGLDYQPLYVCKCVNN